MGTISEEIDNCEVNTIDFGWVNSGSVNRLIKTHIDNFTIYPATKGEKKNADFDFYVNKFKPESSTPEILGKERGVLLTEQWSDIKNIKSKIVSYDKELVHCECLIDEANKIFETRVFPKVIFDNLNVSEVKYIMITIKSKAGSIRIDVYNGKLLVDKNIFEIKDSWNELKENFEVKPFSGFDA